LGYPTVKQGRNRVTHSGQMLAKPYIPEHLHSNKCPRGTRNNRRIRGLLNPLIRP
jgi:hypothetical protein